MDNYTQEVRVQKVEDTSIGQGDRFKKRMAEISRFAYGLSILLSLVIPFLFLNWFYRGKFLQKIKLIKSLFSSGILKENLTFKINNISKWRYIFFKYHDITFHEGAMLSIYFYIVSIILLVIIFFTIASKIVKYMRNDLLNTEAEYQKEIEKRKKMV